ncbi:hypothetical protein [Prosthecobacter sp.]|uniref:hypothetical protein n=1 Tax=Prosthecobacter sp. TaxID=1965333 RepID=UPI001D59EFA3|nr:hypothetical protein [Prosthecobacter sp.]MCB1278693.1 hypothetical protein [Prosthecobacter sp.]
MKPLLHRFIAPGLLLGLLASGSAWAESFSNVDVSNNATIAGAAFFGSIQVDPLGNSSSYGMALDVSQETEEVWGGYITPAHYEDNWVTVEDWGWVESGGYWSPQYSWGVVGQDYFPPVYDEFNNVIEPEHWEDRYDNVYIGDTWIAGNQNWGITGTHTENQQIWVEEVNSTYSELRYNAPVIHQRATRSDANWVWEVPDGGAGTHEIMRLWDGGLALADTSGIGMVLSPSSLTYTRSGTVAGASSSSTTALVGALAATYTTTSVTSGVWGQSKTEVRPEMLRLTRTETASGTTTIGQTQIAARSASFAGVVTVQGDLKVQGVLRVAAHGDISMGEFTNGPMP